MKTHLRIFTGIDSVMDHDVYLFQGAEIPQVGDRVSLFSEEHIDLDCYAGIVRSRQFIYERQEPDINEVELQVEPIPFDESEIYGGDGS